MMPRSFRNGDIPIVFGTNDPNISNEDFLEKVETNFRLNDKNVSEESADDIIGGIDSVCLMIGAFSCRRIGQDEYDRKIYNYEDSDDENSNQNVDTDNKMFRSIIEGANHEVSYVHNAVNHVGKNKWRHICLNMQYVTEKGVIPNPTHPEYTAQFGNHQSSYHDFPRFFKIKRASGEIHDAKWEFNEAIKLHKSKTLNDQNERLYLIAHYLPNPDDDIHDTSRYDFFFKNIPLDNILELNTEIKELTFRYFIWADNQIAEAPSFKSQVMAHYNARHHEWREDRLIPAIKRLNHQLKVNLIYETNPKYNQTINSDYSDPS